MKRFILICIVTCIFSFSIFSEPAQEEAANASGEAELIEENLTEEESPVEEVQAPKEEKKTFFSISARPDISFMSGDIKEYVIDPLCGNTDDIVSRLDWHIKAMPVISLDLKATVFRYVFLNFDGKMGISNSNDYIEDYDWLNYSKKEWKDDPRTEVTNYSKHTNIIQRYNDVSIFAGANFYLPYEIILSPFVGYHYDYVEMDAQNGYFEYKENNRERINISGRGLKYKQESNAFMLGFNILVNSFSHFSIESSYRFSPYLFFINDLDYHFQRGILFYDQMNPTFSLETKQIIMYNFGSRKKNEPSHSAGVTGYIHYLNFVKGPTSQAYITQNGTVIPGTWKVDIGNSGISRFLWSVGLIYQLKIN